MLDPEDWKIVLEVYKGQPIFALGLAQQLTAIRQSLEQGTQRHIRCYRRIESGD
jgi:hypothetical protein